MTPGRAGNGAGAGPTGGNGDGFDEFEELIRDRDEEFGAGWDNPRAGYDPYEDFASAQAGPRGGYGGGYGSGGGFGDRSLVDAITETLRAEGTVGVIVADAAVPTVRKQLERAGIRYDLLGEVAQIFDARVDLVPATLAKGLEFDHVVLLEPSEIVAGEPDETTGLRRLYVCLTRAVTSLIVVHGEPLPAPASASAVHIVPPGWLSTTRPTRRIPPVDLTWSPATDR